MEAAVFLTARLHMPTHVDPICLKRTHDLILLRKVLLGALSGSVG